MDIDIITKIKKIDHLENWTFKSTKLFIFVFATLIYLENVQSHSSVVPGFPMYTVKKEVWQKHFQDIK